MPKSNLNGEELLSTWEAAKAAGVTRKQFAEQLGITEKALDHRLTRASRRRKRGDPEPSEGVSDYEEENYRTITYQGVRHHSVDELLEHLKVDLTIWRIDDRHEVGSWEMGRRAEHKNIRWDNGRIEEGFTEDSGKLYIDTLHRFKVPLVRIHPIPVEPVIQPVQFTIAKWKRAKEKREPTGKALILPDPQVGYRREMQSGHMDPFHDRRAMDIVLQVAQEGAFDYVTYLGDFADFSEWTDRFVREPEFIFTTQPMLIETNWYMARMKEAQPDAEHEAIPGNHEARFRTYMLNHLRQAYKLKPATELHLDEPMSIKRMFGLDAIGVKLAGDYPNGEVWYGDYARSIHGHKISSNPGGTVTNLIKDLTYTTIFGHIHRREIATKTIDDSQGIREVTAASPGCLCRIDYVVPGHAKGQHWQQGFGVLHYDSRSPFVEIIQIMDGEAVYNGKRYRGNDYRTQLEHDTGWKF